MKKTLFFFVSSVLLLALSACGSGPASTSINPGLHTQLHKIEGQALNIDADLQQDFQTKLDEIIERTDLDIENMDDDTIVQAARYFGYFGQQGKAIEIYETALQFEKFQGYLVLHHNLGRLYESVQEWDHAQGRYEWLISRGNTNYQKDLDKVIEKKEAAE